MSGMVIPDNLMEILTDMPNGSPSWTIYNPAAPIRDLLVEHEEFEMEVRCNRVQRHGAWVSF